MPFDWDPVKAESNLAKHGITFRQALRVFDDPGIRATEVTKPEHGEERFKAVGRVDEVFITVVYTDRDAVRRIISARRSRRNERRDYNDQGTASR